MKQITIAGNIGKSAEIRRTQNGDAVAGFSVAVSRGRDDPTTWFDCSLWGKRAETLAQYLTKGSKVTVCGEFSTREHEGKTYLQVKVSDVALQGGGQQGGQSSGGQDGGYGNEHDEHKKAVNQMRREVMDDEIPF